MVKKIVMAYKAEMVQCHNCIKWNWYNVVYDIKHDDIKSKWHNVVMVKSRYGNKVVIGYKAEMVQCRNYIKSNWCNVVYSIKIWWYKVVMA
jgi:hypothetical protein